MARIMAVAPRRPGAALDPKESPLATTADPGPIATPPDLLETPALQDPSSLAEAEALGRRIVDELDDRQAEEIVLLDVSAVAGFTDYFVIASAASSRQFEALADAVERAVGDRTYRREGGADGGWLLFDFSHLIVHIFGRDERAYYNLEGLWSGGRQLLRVE